MDKEGIISWNELLRECTVLPNSTDDDRDSQTLKAVVRCVPFTGQWKHMEEFWTNRVSFLEDGSWLQGEKWSEQDKTGGKKND